MPMPSLRSLRWLPFALLLLPFQGCMTAMLWGDWDDSERIVHREHTVTAAMALSLDPAREDRVMITARPEGDAPPPRSTGMASPSSTWRLRPREQAGEALALLRGQGGFLVEDVHLAIARTIAEGEMLESFGELTIEGRFPAGSAAVPLTRTALVDSEGRVVHTSRWMVDEVPGARAGGPERAVLWTGVMELVHHESSYVGGNPLSTFVKVLFTPVTVAVDLALGAGLVVGAGYALIHSCDDDDW